MDVGEGAFVVALNTRLVSVLAVDGQSKRHRNAATPKKANLVRYRSVSMFKDSMKVGVYLA